MLVRPENRLLADLPPAVYERLAPGLERIGLTEGSVLLDIGRDAEFVWFIAGGVVSLLSATKGGDTLEAAMIGCEGAIGLSSLTHANGSPLRARVQIAGEALRIRPSRLRVLCRRDKELQESVSGYLHTLIALITQTMACHHFHSVEQKLARWLLMARDRTASDKLQITHTTLAGAFGVARSHISAAAGSLDTGGLIRCRRGTITILNRAGLAKTACECYRALTGKG
jgi:CRP-like cAMP-binding protein